MRYVHLVGSSQKIYLYKLEVSWLREKKMWSCSHPLLDTNTISLNRNTHRKK